MSKPSHIPLFPDAYLRDNYRLTLEQHGLFLVLMMEAWNKPDCSLPDNDVALANIAGITPARFRKIAPEVLEKWTRSDGRIYQKRLRKEWLYVQEVRAKRAAAGKLGGRPSGKANEKQMESTYGGGGGVGDTSLSQDKVDYESLGVSRLRAVDGGAK